MLDDPGRAEHDRAVGDERGLLPMSNGLSRLETRFLGEPERVDAKCSRRRGRSTRRAGGLEAGLVSFAPDDIDWDDEVRMAIEERAALLARRADRHGGQPALRRPETMETKIFGRLTAWQNWIFQRPNAVGERGALTVYGRPRAPEFDWKRT
jgi:benzoyl-CoA-dihydrodiol lyase